VTGNAKVNRHFMLVISWAMVSMAETGAAERINRRMDIATPGNDESSIYCVFIK